MLRYVLLLLGLSAASLAAEERQPNIVLFFVDDLGWFDVGYRNSDFESPHIDQLAAEAVDYEQAYIATPACSPSRATLLTGQHPVRLRMVRHIPKDAKNGFDAFGRTDQEFNLWETDPAQFPSRNWVPLEEITYAEALRDLGYYNLFVGKWHLGHEPYHPVKQGFDAQIGTSNAGHPSSYYPDFFAKSEVLDEEEEGYLTDVLTDRTVEFIENYDRDQPFQISMWYYNVHTPHQGREDYVKHFESRGFTGRRAHYQAMLKSVDDSVGRVRAALVAKGVADDTVIIFTSDQGSWFTEGPTRGGKRIDTLGEGGARVPFYILWPGVTQPGVKQRSIVQSTDLFPTMVEMAGGDVSDYTKLDGVSLLPTLHSAEEWTRPAAIFGYRAYEDLYASVREGDWKLWAYRSGKVELYNVQEDPFEQRDIAYRDRETTLKMSLLGDALVDFEHRMDVYDYSGIKNQQLIMSYYTRKRLEPAEPTAEQNAELDKLDHAVALDIRGLRHAHDIDLATIHHRDHWTSTLRKQGVKGTALLEGMIEKAGLTPIQAAGFRAIEKRKAEYQAAARAVLTDEQRAKL